MSDHEASCEIRALIQGQACRLAWRKERDQVNCYLAPVATMDGAVLIASYWVEAFAHDGSSRGPFWKDVLAAHDAWLKRQVKILTGADIDLHPQIPLEPPEGHA